MRIRTHPKNLYKWERWFAWYPVIIKKDTNKENDITVWLEFVERYFYYRWGDEPTYDYRLIDEKAKETRP